MLLLGDRSHRQTTIHLARVPIWRALPAAKGVSAQNGQPTRFDYGEIDHCCQNFALVDGWLDARGLQRLGTVGRARSRLARSRDVVAVVIERLRRMDGLSASLWD